MVVAPASRLFSIISFKALAGRRMTSPAAIRFTTASSNRLIFLLDGPPPVFECKNQKRTDTEHSIEASAGEEEQQHTKGRRVWPQRAEVMSRRSWQVRIVVVVMVPRLAFLPNCNFGSFPLPGLRLREQMVIFFFFFFFFGSSNLNNICWLFFCYFFFWFLAFVSSNLFFYFFHT